MAWDDRFDAAPLSWAYVAGFTDGEGYVGMSKGHFKVTLYQNSDQAYVLNEIQDFLAEHGINAALYEAKRAKDERHPTVGYYLMIRRVRDVHRFLMEIRPYAIVKAPAIRYVLREIEKKATESTRSVYEGLGG